MPSALNGQMFFFHPFQVDLAYLNIIEINYNSYFTIFLPLTI